MSQQPMHSAKELTEILIKYHDLHEGIYALSLEFQFGLGMFGPTPEQTLPGAIVSLAKVGINKVEAHAFNTVDAAEVNPVPGTTKAAKPRAQRKSRTVKGA